MEQQLNENFVRGFAKECFDMGLTEKQASVALDAYMEKSGFMQFGRGVGQLLSGLWNVGAPTAKLTGKALNLGLKAATPFRYAKTTSGKVLGAAAEAGLGAYGLNELGKTDTAIGDFLNHTIGAGSWLNGGLRDGDIDPRVLGGGGYGDGGYSGPFGEDYYERMGAINTSAQGPLGPRYWNDNELASGGRGVPSGDYEGTSHKMSPVLLDEPDVKRFGTLRKTRGKLNRDISSMQEEIDAVDDPALKQALSAALHKSKKQRASAEKELRGLALESNKRLAHQQEIARGKAVRAGNRSAQLARDLANANQVTDAYEASNWSRPSTWKDMGKYWLARALNRDIYGADGARQAAIARRLAKAKRKAEAFADAVGDIDPLNP